MMQNDVVMVGLIITMYFQESKDLKFQNFKIVGPATKEKWASLY